VLKIRASDATLLGIFNTMASPKSNVFDGSTLWVIHGAGAIKL